jgi:hypothetical protein
LDHVKGLVEAQRKHVIKLNRSNARLVAKHLSTGKNLDAVAARIMNKPHLFQRIVSFFNPNGAKNIQLFNELQSYGFNQDQLKAIQQAVATNDIDAVKTALTEAAKHSDEVATGIAQAGAATAATSSTSPTPEDMLKKTVQSKGNMGALRNHRNVMSKVMKGLAVVGVALEGFNLYKNLKNEDHRKAASDLTTAVGVGLVTAGIITATGLVGLPAIAAGIGIGWVLNKVGAPLVDKLFKKFTGLTNKNERDEKKLAVELNKVQQQLATVPVA